MNNVESVSGNDLKLRYGAIEMCIETGGWSTNYSVDITWCVDYNRPDLELYRFNICSSLQEALSWYEDQDKSFNICLGGVK